MSVHLSHWPRRARLLPYAALWIYSALAFHQILLPGFYYDEALDLPPALQMARGWPVALFPHDPGLSLFGRTFPLMILDYVGTVNTYLLTPIFALAGASGFVVRAFEVAIGLVMLALSGRLAREWFGWGAAGLTTLFVAGNPSFIFWSRMGISVTSVMGLCSLGSLLGVEQWARSGRARWLLVAGLLLGLGLWAKFLFVWWLAAAGAVYAALEWKRWLPRRAALARGEIPGVGWRAWAAGIFGFLIGTGPLIYYNLKTGKTVELLLNALNAPTSYGVNNLRLLDNLRAALEQFRIFLDGSYFWYNGQIHFNPWAYSIYLFSGLGAAALCRRWPLRVRRRALASLILVAAVVVQSAFTVSGIWATHLFILIPFPQMLAALAVLGLWRLGAGARRPVRWSALLAAAALASALAGGDLSATLGYHRSLARTGGIGRFSDAVYALARYLEQQRLTTPAALDWGMEKNLLILTDGRVQPQEIFGYSAEPDEGFRERVEAALCDGCAFINTDSRYAVFPREAAFRELAAAAGYEVVLDENAIFRERSGQAAFLVYRVRPKTTSP
jgi:hypothetical protein